MADSTWQDVFLTKPDYGGQGQGSPQMDDLFVAPVMSVAVQRKKEADATDIYAKPVKGGSNWLMLGFPGDAAAAEITRWRDLAVGDMIRVGTAGVGGFTDYLTVLETVDATRLYNTTAGDWQIATLDPNTDSGVVLNKPDGSGYDTGGQSLNAIGTTDYAIERASGGLPIGSLRCVRVNYSIDATTLDTTLHLDSTFTGASATASNLVTDANRGEVSVYYPLSGTRSYDGADRREIFYFPCYRQREWTESTVLRMQMPTNIKRIGAVKLIGYSMIHKRSVGTQQQHEHKEDDWFALRIKELRSNASVLSNNRHANDAFHVIHTGNSGADVAGSVELYSYELGGLACATFTPVNLPSLTVELVDRHGREAHFGRMHLWLKVLVSRD